jgi:hypothetical protein
MALGERMQAHVGGLGFGQHQLAEWAWYMHGVRRSCGQLLGCEGAVDCRGESWALEGVAEQNETLGTREVLACFGDGLRTCLVKLVDAVRRSA